MRRTAFLQQALAFGLPPLSAYWGRASAEKPPRRVIRAALSARLEKGGAPQGLPLVFSRRPGPSEPVCSDFGKKNPNF